MHHKLLALVAALATALPFATQEVPKKAPAGPVVGQPAPSFRLNDETGRARSIGGEADHWTVLAFYPKAATPG